MSLLCCFFIQHIVDRSHQSINGSHDDILIYTCAPEIFAVLVVDADIGDGFGAGALLKGVLLVGLQHPPETLVEMYRLWEQGYEVIEGVKRSRGKESILHRASAGMFYKIMSKAVQIDMSRASDFKLMDRKAVEALLSMPERNAFFRALSSWVGYRTTSVEFDVQERTEGESKWSTWSLIKYAVRNIVGFSSAPLQMITVAGVLTLLLAVVLGIQSLVKYFCGHALEGFTTVILLLLIIGSLIMLSLGVIGIYIAKIYEEVKGRPRYFIARKISGRKKDN